MSLAERLEQVYAGPQGPDIGAFFDFDGTLISGFSAGDLYYDRARRLDIGVVEALRTVAALVGGVESEEDFERLVAVGFEAFKGHHESDVLDIGHRIFSGRVASRVFPEAWQLVQAHQRMGHTVVLASSATRYQLEPAALTLGIDHILCTALEVDEDGVLTGRALGKTLWREGKAQAVRDFSAAKGVDLERSYAYSNGNEDIRFLEQVAFPAATTPESKLLAHAEEQGWPILDFGHRGMPGPRQIVRSVAAYGGMAAGYAVGAGLGLLNQDRKLALEAMSTLSTEAALGIAGVRLSVQGEEHLWSRRPAVFIFNHQSQLDVLITSNLVRRDFTGVAKAELARDPFMGPIFRFAGVAFVERDGKSDPRTALAPALERLRSGVSVIIAPEGTRSLTPSLGVFKMGAFHMAREAGVPVVPIVIRNAGELMWRDSVTIRPGTVDVVVHPPIEVADWPADELRERVGQVRQMFADTLAAWPGRGVSPKAMVDSGEVGTASKAPAKKAATKKAVAKKSAAKKAVAKKSAAKKASATKPAAQKAATRKSAAKKASATRSPAKRTTAPRRRRAANASDAFARSAGSGRAGRSAAAALRDGADAARTDSGA